MAKDDFFLSFGTDADIFASKIVSESERASGAIYDLAQALQDYDRTLENTKRGGPLQNLFSVLDDAAGKFGQLTNELVNGMSTALRGVGELTSELAGLVDAVEKINSLRPQAKRKVQSAVSEVTDDEIVATNAARRSGKALGEVIELNATEARNALKRVADINATVGRNSNSAADGLKELAKQIRELSGAAKEAKGRGTVGQIANTAAQQIIVVQGGTVQAGEGSQINVADILAQAAANTPKPAERPLTDQQADAQVRAEAKRRRNDPEPLADLNGPARSGLYSYPGLSENGRRGGRLVGADVRDNESFGDYFARNDATRARIEESRAALPKPNREDLADFNQFKLSGGKAKDFASGLESTFKRALQEDKTASAITAESIKASLTDLGLEQQYPKLPEIIARVFKVRAEQRIAAEKTVRELIAEDPAVSFGGGAFGTQNSDFEVGNTFPAALAKVDEELINTHEGDPETVRLAQKRRQAQEDRKLLRSRPRPFENAVDPGILVGDVGTPEQEGLTQAARRKEDAKNRRDARLRNKELVASLDPIDPESLRARRQGNPELQKINALLGKRGLNAGDIAETLGVQGETRRNPASNEAEFVRAADRREVVQSKIDAIKSDPEGYVAALKKISDAAVEATRPALELADAELRLAAAEAAYSAEVESRAKKATADPRGLLSPHEQEEARLAEVRRRRENPDPESPALQAREAAREDFERSLRVARGQERNPVPAQPAEIQPVEQIIAGLEREIGQLSETLRSLTTSKVFDVGENGEARARKVLEDRRAEILSQTATPASASREEVVQNTARRTGGRGTQAPDRVTIYRGESAEAGSASNAQSGKDLRGRFFTDDLPTAQQYAGEGGRVVSTTVSARTLERARNRAIQEKVLEGLVVSQAVAKGASPLGETPEVVTNAARAARPPRKKGALVKARELVEQLKAQVAADTTEDDVLLGQLETAEIEVRRLSAARAPKAGAAGGGGGQPPRPPRNAGAAGTPDPDDSTPRGPRRDAFGQDPSKKTQASSSQQSKADYTEQLRLLKDTTRAILDDAKARLQSTKAIADQTERIRAQDAILVEAGAAFRADPAFKQFPNLTTARGAFAQGVGLPATKDNYNTVQQLFTRGGGIDASGLANKAKAAADAPSKATGASEEGGTLGKALFGQRGFLDSQLRHIGSAIENFAGFQLVFSGFEKFKELVETGLQADVTFVRLNATLAATGRTSNGLRTAFSRISSETGEDLKKVVEAGAELAGVFSTNADLVKGVEVSSQLANISQGTLTAKEAAIGLRDVTDAYAVTGSQGIQAVGDQIARLSVITGVTVKDITEGSTQLAQEAHEFGLSQRQAVTLTSFVTKSTGESGEQAAEQTSRLLSTLNTGKVQDQLVKLNVATREQFASGDIGGVLTNLLTQFDKLTPSAQQSIASLVGAGRQARAFTGLIRDGAQIVAEFNNKQSDFGSLAKQNDAILGTVSGNIKKLGEDFRNVGQTLQQLGVFDILGVVAKAVDSLLVAFNTLGQGLAEVFNSNPILKNFKDLTVTLLEAVVAFKILGPVAGSVLGKLGIGGAQAAARAEANVLGAEAAAAGGAARAAGPRTSSGRGFGGIFLPARIPGALASDVETRRLVSIQPNGAALGQPVAPGLGGPVNGIRGAGFFPTVAGAPFQAGGRLFSALGRGLQGAGGADPGAIARGVQRIGVASASAGTGIQSLGTRIQLFGETSRIAAVGMAGLSAALGAALILLPFVIQGIQQRNQREKEGLAFQDSLRGGPKPGEDTLDPLGANKDLITQQDRANQARNPGVIERATNAITGGPKGTSKLDRANNILNTFSFGIPDFIGNEIKHPGTNPLDNYRASEGQSSGSGGDPSDKFNKDYFKLLNSQFGRLKGTKGGTEEDAKTAIADNDKEFKDQVDKLVAEAGDEPAQEAARAQLASLQQSVNESGQRRLQVNKGLNLLDVLNAKQIVGLGELVTVTQNLNKKTLGQIGGLLNALESDKGIAVGSAADKDFKTSIDPNATNQQRRQANIRNLQAGLKQGQDKLNTDPLYAAGPVRDALISALEQQANTLSQLQGVETQNAQALGAANADFLAKSGDPTAAADAMKVSVAGIKEVLANLDATQPEYFAALGALIDAEQKTAELAALPQINAIKINSSKTLNSVTRAEDAQKIANVNLDTANTAAKASGTVGDNNPNVVAAKIAKNEADLAAVQAKADEALSANQLQAAVLQATADSVGADRTLLIGLQGKTGRGGALATAIANYGTNSSQANAIRVQIIQQKEKLDNDLADALNATLDLEIATLNARGKSGDAERAAKDQTQEVQNNINAYKKRTGDASLSKPEGQRLKAQLITARRNAFDVALNAQLETLDFQKETYQITSSQEIQALQEILKNKQLTLKEQRDITLKIKSLQDSVRQQLTGGGFNIPTDIKLPTAFQVRRSLGGNAGNGSTTVNNVSRATNNVSINNNVPTAAVATQIANQVIAVINSQTGQSARANTSTPRLVGA